MVFFSGFFLMAAISCLSTSSWSFFLSSDGAYFCLKTANRNIRHKFLSQEMVHIQHNGPYLFLLGENFTLLLLCPLLAVTAEVLIIDLLRHLHSRDVNLGACGNDEILVYSAKGACINFERSCNNEQSYSYASKHIAHIANSG